MTNQTIIVKIDHGLYVDDWSNMSAYLLSFAIAFAWIVTCRRYGGKKGWSLRVFAEVGAYFTLMILPLIILSHYFGIYTFTSVNNTVAGILWMGVVAVPSVKYVMNHE